MLCDGLADKVRRCSFASCATLCGAVPWALHCAANRLAVFRTRRSRTRLQLCTSTCAASCASRRMVSEGTASLRSNSIVGAPPPHVCTSTDSVRSARSPPLPYAADSRRAVLAKPSQASAQATLHSSVPKRLVDWLHVADLLVLGCFRSAGVCNLICTVAALIFRHIFCGCQRAVLRAVLRSLTAAAVYCSECSRAEVGRAEGRALAVAVSPCRERPRTDAIRTPMPHPLRSAVHGL